ncbi:tripartite motif-containing protein 16 [Betta splendens]|uniref:Tripartite motif-containing protein 16 n=1 Tax=Betta splendens TaxID=158456 RepID=A0A6P7L9I5_BETSP|nr:tripartite motif-containing protein 16 [Betta splendens]
MADAAAGEEPLCSDELNTDQPEPADTLQQNPPEPEAAEVQDAQMGREVRTQDELDAGSPGETMAGSEPATEDEGENGAEEEANEQEPPLGPDDVACDSCIESPRRALKSCLTCLVSYCEAHLRPHREKPNFHNHRLVEPLRDIERRTCESHKWPLALFCLADACCVCQDCVAEDHTGHGAVPVAEARRQIERELKEKQTETVKTATAAENAIEKLQVNTVSIEQSVTEVRGVVENQFQKLQAMVEKAHKEVTEILEVEYKQAMKQVEGIRVHLEQRCTELKKRQAQIEKLSRNKNDVDFLQDYSEWKKEAADVSLPGVYIGLVDGLKAFSRVITDSTQELCTSLESSYIEKVRKTCKNDKTGIKTTVHEIAAILPDPVTHADFLKYVANMSFDADTAHKFLRLTEENRKVANTTPWQHPYPDLPERFENWRQVLTTESFYLGRHYFEADISGEGTHIGLTYKSIDRKGTAGDSCITGNNFSWCLQWNGRSFSAWHSGVETPLGVGKFTRIGAYVDYKQGLLAFYGVDDKMTLIHRYQAEFREPLYLAVWLPKKENVVALVAPGDPIALRNPSPPRSPPNGPAAS